MYRKGMLRPMVRYNNVWSSSFNSSEHIVPSERLREGVHGGMTTCQHV